MDTPDKTQITPSSSLSKFEDSPVFKYISTLSPIELAKSRQTDSAFNSIAFLSPSSLFPSPQIGCHRESRFSVKRHHFLAPSNSRVLQSGNDSNTDEGASEVQPSHVYDDQVKCDNNGSSSRGLSSDLLDEQSNLAIELPRTLKYDCGSPDCSMVPRDEILKNTSVEVAGEEGSSLQCNKDQWEERQQSFENERDLRKICRIFPSEESAGCEWVAVVSDVADLLTLNSSIIYESTEGQDQRNADPGTTSFASAILQPQDDSSNLGNAETGDSSGSCKQSELADPITDQTPAILSTCLVDKLVVSDSGLKKDDKEEKCKQSCRQQRSIRRRCLVFEKAPGFGLHLNSLANTSKGQNHLSKVTPSPMKSGEVPHDNKVIVTESSPQTPATVGGNEADQNSPEKKRQKFENIDESTACKRCNCKRSKCLKLYCDCFAAGLYCIEPCSCQDCFNKPIHENVVLETRRQIESRNPLAFAPKVIRSMDDVSDSRGETNKTPASARHKRGCNCKKSSCLKKYCECFQGGVGCSSNCRCEGCKNSFGRKDGGDESEFDVEALETSEMKAPEENSLAVVISKGEEYQNLSAPSTNTSRLPFAYSGKLLKSFPLFVRSSPQVCTTQELDPSDLSSCRPKFESDLQAIPENETPKVLKHNCPPLALKPTSPNCKRVSPPHHDCSSSTTWHTRKFILKSVPSFPSFSPP
ncbi:hypothetical protein COLO4_15295 [Corchorus olitorius]|uniref:CRC domain-containing protein n=1 Tax=Corchorus olitorius TaxID=93759 RepID=A0A1R3JNH7_9ROSI|nr:hypothetical protein COLO4_15295 [Corchorus olitorius]